MKILLLLLTVVRLYESAAVHGAQPTNDGITPEMVKQLESIERRVGALSRQTMLQQLFVEERIRSEGDSGIKRVRDQRHGSQAYYGATHVSAGVAGVTDASWSKDHAFFGEVDAVINGVDFRTTPNWYPLRMPAKHSKTWYKTEPVPFPDVPHSVLHQKNFDSQVAEMREYFRAFQHQDTRIRDYRPYFKPVLCYLEGHWLKNYNHGYEEDRRDHVRFMSYAGESMYEGNKFPYLHRTVINVTEEGKPEFAQWRYRKLCHPIKTELKLQDLKLVEDLATRMSLNKTLHDFAMTKAARYVLAPNHGYRFVWQDGYGHFNDGGQGYSLLDRIMAEIPGLDNYPGHTEDNSFEMEHMSMAFRNNTKLNTAFYHRWYKVNRPGAMGITTRHRGYADANLWVAETTQSAVAAMSVKDCPYVAKLHKKVCHRYTKRMTYAMPLEIIWLTPLNKWNPRNLVIHSNDAIPRHNRPGTQTVDKAYNGTSPGTYLLTPAEFFFGNRTAKMPWLKGVLDRNGKVQVMVGAGSYIILPKIEGKDPPIRLRYPIMPVHAEGRTSYKELSALETIAMDMNRYKKMFEVQP